MYNKKIRIDLICENCSQNEATTLLYFEKYHKESGRISLINPSFICDKCVPLFLNLDNLFENRPRLVSFEEIGQWDGRLLGLASKTRWEFSAFRNPFFRKKLHRIRFVWRNGRKADAESTDDNSGN